MLWIRRKQDQGRNPNKETGDAGVEIRSGGGGNFYDKGM